jgi:hypothetical protein
VALVTNRGCLIVSFLQHMLLVKAAYGVSLFAPERASVLSVRNTQPPRASGLNCSCNALGPVLGVGVMAKGPRGWSREDLGGGARGLVPARVGLLGLQCSARVLSRTASFKIK